MKKAVTIAFLLFCFTASAAAQKDPDWIKYISAEGRYSVSLPSEPEISQEEATNAEGVKFLQFLALSSYGNGAFLVSYFDNRPNNTFSLDKGRDGMVSAVKGTLISEDSISLGGSPGRQIKVAAARNGINFLIRARFYEIGGRIYVLQCIFPKDEDGPSTDAKASKFFDSFSVKTGG